MYMYTAHPYIVTVRLPHCTVGTQNVVYVFCNPVISLQGGRKDTSKAKKQNKKTTTCVNFMQEVLNAYHNKIITVILRTAISLVSTSELWWRWRTSECTPEWRSPNTPSESRTRLPMPRGPCRLPGRNTPSCWYYLIMSTITQKSTSLWHRMSKSSVHVYTHTGVFPEYIYMYMYRRVWVFVTSLCSI